MSFPPRLPETVAVRASLPGITETGPGPVRPGPVGSPAVQSMPPARPFQADPRLLQNARAQMPVQRISTGGNQVQNLNSPVRQRIEDVIREARRDFRSLTDRATKPARVGSGANKGKPLTGAARAAALRTANNALMGTLLRASPVISAGQGGYALGTEIYNRFEPQISGGVDAIAAALANRN